MTKKHGDRSVHGVIQVDNPRTRTGKARPLEPISGCLNDNCAEAADWIYLPSMRQR
jgi:hypothetical protein